AADAARLGAALRACERAWRWEQCLQLVDLDSASAGADALALAASACASAKLWQRAVRLLANGRTAAEVAGLARAYGQGLAWQQSLSAFNRLEEVDLVAADAVFKAYADTSQWARALQLLEALPSGRADGSLLAHCLAALEDQHLRPLFLAVLRMCASIDEHDEHGLVVQGALLASGGEAAGHLWRRLQQGPQEALGGLGPLLARQM
ncbi:unnamed protein product, partial [Effrenium voratum]